MNPTQQLTLYAADSLDLANPIPSLESALPPQTSATCGASTPESFAKLSPDGCWLKTYLGYCQAKVDGSLEEFSETWPRAGIVSSGIAYRRQPLAPLTDEIECGLWPTPTTPSGGRGIPRNVVVQGKSLYSPSGQKVQFCLENAVKMWPTPTVNGNYNRQGVSKKSGDGLATAVRMWPTPKGSPSGPDYARMNRPRSGGDDLATAVARTQQSGGQLNPTWVEWLMGYEIGWTDLER